MESNTKHILIACTGSVATIKLPVLVQQLFDKAKESQFDIEIKVICTDKAKHFINDGEIPSHVQLLSDDDEWNAWTQRGDPVVHIDLGKWADVMLIAPLNANSLAKIATGICDNLLLCTVRAWDFEKPLIFCPAMNTRMWDHPLTQQHINILMGWGFIEVPCISKTLMCGDTGNGAMAEVGSIVTKVIEIIRNKIVGK